MVVNQSRFNWSKPETRVYSSEEEQAMESPAVPPDHSKRRICGLLSYSLSSTSSRVGTSMLCLGAHFAIKSAIGVYIICKNN